MISFMPLTACLRLGHAAPAVGHAELVDVRRLVEAAAVEGIHVEEDPRHADHLVSHTIFEEDDAVVQRRRQRLCGETRVGLHATPSTRVCAARRAFRAGGVCESLLAVKTDRVADDDLLTHAKPRCRPGTSFSAKNWLGKTLVFRPKRCVNLKGAFPVCVR